MRDPGQDSPSRSWGERPRAPCSGRPGAGGGNGDPDTAGGPVDTSALRREAHSGRRGRVGANSLFLQLPCTPTCSNIDSLNFFNAVDPKFVKTYEHVCRKLSRRGHGGDMEGTRDTGGTWGGHGGDTEGFSFLLSPCFLIYLPRTCHFCRRNYKVLKPSSLQPAWTPLTGPCPELPFPVPSAGQRPGLLAVPSLRAGHSCCSAQAGLAEGGGGNAGP